ncbi:unnamed protein product [Arctogadus glacialis]
MGFAEEASPPRGNSTSARAPVSQAGRLERRLAPCPHALRWAPGLMTGCSTRSPETERSVVNNPCMNSELCLAFVLTSNLS